MNKERARPSRAPEVEASPSRTASFRVGKAESRWYEGVTAGHSKARHAKAWIDKSFPAIEVKARRMLELLQPGASPDGADDAVNDY